MLVCLEQQFFFFLKASFSLILVIKNSGLFFYQCNYSIAIYAKLCDVRAGAQTQTRKLFP